MDDMDEAAMQAWPHEWPHEYLHLSDLGYLVYRRAFDTARCSLEAGARAHKVAVFVCESDADDYCRYRNAMTMKYGTDDVAVIAWPGKPRP